MTVNGQRQSQQLPQQVHIFHKLLSKLKGCKETTQKTLPPLQKKKELFSYVICDDVIEET